MATKNLARTVIEGGRYKGNKWDRRNSHAEFRARDKNFLQEVNTDPENWYDYDSEPIEKVYKGFKDKLSPMYRWLHAQVGRPWDEVRSEVAERFDTRTTAGRHIVYDHLLSSVEVTPDLRYGRYYRGPEDYTESYSRNDFYVDEVGFLQSKSYIKRKYKAPKFDTNRIANWLSGRVVGLVGNKLFWFVPTTQSYKYRGMRGNRTWTTQWGYKDRYYYSYHYDSPLRFLFLAQEPIHRTDKLGRTVYDENNKPIVEGYREVWRDYNPSFRQDRKLNEKELAFWNTVPEFYQNKVLQRSPTYVETEEEKAARKRRYGYY